MRFLQVVPDTNAERLLVREQDVSFQALSVIDHDVDHIARLYANLAAGVLELFDGD